MRNLLKIGILTLVLSPLAAGLKFDLSSAVDYALKHSPTYLQAVKSTEAAKAQARKASSLFLPQVKLQGQDILRKKVFTVEIPPLFPGDRPKKVKMDFTRKYQFGLNLTQPLFTSGRLTSTYRINQLQAKAAEMDLLQKRLDLIYQVKKAFYSVLLARKMVEIQKESSRLAYEHYRQVKALYEVGSATKFELLQAKVNWENTKPDLLQAENSLRLARLNFKNLLGLEGDFELEGNLYYYPLEVDLKTLEKFALSHSPALLAIKYRTEAAAQGINLARSQFGPSLALVFDYNFRSQNFNFKANNWEDYYTLALSFSVPLFSGFSRVEDLRAATSQFYSAKYGEQALRQAVLMRLQAAYRRAKQAQASYLSARDTVKEAKEGVRLAKVNYQQALITSLQVEQARLSLKMAEMNMFNALYQYNEALAEIESITGYKFGGEK